MDGLNHSIWPVFWGGWRGGDVFRGELLRRVWRRLMDKLHHWNRHGRHACPLWVHVLGYLRHRDPSRADGLIGWAERHIGAVQWDGYCSRIGATERASKVGVMHGRVSLGGADAGEVETHGGALREWERRYRLRSPHQRHYACIGLRSYKNHHLFHTYGD